MGPMPAPPDGPPPPRGLDAFFDRLRGLGLHRDTRHKWAGGVCSGLAARIGIDPVIVRAGFIALLVFGGSGLLLYLVALALVPDPDGRIWAEEAVRRGDPRGILLLVVIAADLVDELRHRWWLWIAVPGALVAWWIVRGGRCGSARGGVLGGHPTTRESGTGGQPPPASPGMPPPASSGQPPQASRGMPPQPATPGWPGSAYPATSGPSTPSDPAAATVGAPGAAVPAPHGMGPGRTYAGVSAPKAPIIVRERRPSGGFTGFALVLGLGVLAFGLAWSAARDWGVRAPEVPFGLACAVGVVGIALVVKGLRGRRAPLIGALAVLTALAALATAVIPSGLGQFSATAGERTWVPVAGASDPNYRLGMGSARLDLSGLTAATTDNQPVTASVGMGEILLVVPEGLVVVVDATVSAGEIGQRADGADQGTSITEGTGLHEVVQVGSGPTDVRVTATIGLGALTIQPSGRQTATPSAPAPTPSAPALTPTAPAPVPTAPAPVPSAPAPVASAPAAPAAMPPPVVSTLRSPA